MKTVKQAVLLAIYGGLGMAVAGVSHAQLNAVDEQVRIGVVHSNESMFWSGRFTGMNRDETYIDFSAVVDYRSDYDADRPERWRMEARNLGLDSRSLRIDFIEQGFLSGYFSYRGIPNKFFQDIGSPYQISGNTMSLPDGGNQNTVEDNLTRHNLGTQREQVAFGGRMNLDSQWRFSGNFHQDKKEGTKLRGFVDNFWANQRSVVAVAPIDYTTTRANADLSYDSKTLQTRIGYAVSFFRQDNGDRLEYDYLFNNDWSTAPQRVESLEPDNTFHQVSASIAYRPLSHIRLGADVAMGRMLQNAKFITGPLDSGETSLDGEIRTTLVNLRASAKPMPKLNLRASYRYDDRDNRTAQIDGLLFASPGMAAPVTPRSTRPVSFTERRLNAEAAYQAFERTNLTLGVTSTEKERTYDDRAKNDEMEIKLGVRSRWLTNYIVGGELLGAQQRGSQWESLTGPVELRKYYLADRDRIGGTLYVSATPSDRLQVTYRGELTEDDYLNSELGLQDSTRGLMAIDLSYFPVDTLNTYMFYAFERREATQRGFETATSTAWRGQRDDQSLTLGLGAEYQLANPRYKVGGELNYMDSVARNVVTRNDIDPAYPIVRAKLQQLSVFGSYQVKKNMIVSMRYMYEQYRETDWGTDGYGVDGPGSLVLPDKDAMDYAAHMVGLALRYQF